MAEDDFTSHISQKRLKKRTDSVQEQAREKAANTLMWSPAPDEPILIPYYPAVPNHSDVWIDRTSKYPKSGKTDT